MTKTSNFLDVYPSLGRQNQRSIPVCYVRIGGSNNLLKNRTKNKLRKVKAWQELSFLVLTKAHRSKHSALRTLFVELKLGQACRMNDERQTKATKNPAWEGIIPRGYSRSGEYRVGTTRRSGRQRLHGSNFVNKGLFKLRRQQQRGRTCHALTALNSRLRKRPGLTYCNISKPYRDGILRIMRRGPTNSWPMVSCDVDVIYVIAKRCA